MSSFFALLGCGIAVGILSQILRTTQWAYGNLLSVMGGIVLLSWALLSMSDLFSLFTLLATGLQEMPYMDLVLKSIGIGFVTKLGVNCCMDMGESAIATNLELCGRLAILTVISPLIIAVVEVVRKGTGL